MTTIGSTLKLATWNLALPVSLRRRDAIQEHIDREDAEVWVFTEAHDKFTAGGDYHCSSEEGRDDDDEAEHRWVTIRSRFPVTRVPTSDDKRSACVRVQPPEGEPFIVYGSVLPWIGSAWNGHASRGGVAFRRALEMQTRDWSKIQEDYQDAEFFILGDLNQDLATPPYYGSKANRCALEESLAACKLRALTAGEDDPVRRDSSPCATIDHVCARQSSRWRVKETRRWPDAPKPVRSLSDHFGILVELERVTTS